MLNYKCTKLDQLNAVLLIPFDEFGLFQLEHIAQLMMAQTTTSYRMRMKLLTKSFTL